MFPFFLESPELRKWRQRQHEAMVERRLPLCVSWESITKWQPQLNVKAETFKPPIYFPNVTPSKNPNPNYDEVDKVLSPKGEWCFMVKRLPAGALLKTASSRGTGDVLFDGEVLISAIHRRLPYDPSRWDDNPFMSVTPAEILSLRPGTKLAKGRVIVAGLGLGYQLIEVSRRKQVKELVLVEKSQDLVDWLWPHIEPRLDERFRGKVEIVVGDAYEEVPKMTADVALIDIFPSYGSNSFHRAGPCLGIGRVWCWGGPRTRE